MRLQFKINLFLGMISVILGAFAAHSLKSQIEPEQIITFQTGVRYQFMHVFAGLFAYLYYKQYPHKLINIGAWFFLIGIGLFSGSLYLLSCRNILNIEHWNFLGPLTPIGGLCFVIGWLMILFASFNSKSKF